MPAPRHIVELTDTDNPTKHDIYPVAIPCAYDDTTDEKAEKYARQVYADLHAEGLWKADPSIIRFHRRTTN